MLERKSFAAAALAACAISIGACNSGADRNEQNDSAQNVAAVDAPRLPVVEPPLDRAALLLAVAKAGSDIALGRDDGETQRNLDGKRFEMRIRFGCPVPESPVDSGSYASEFAEGDRTLRLKAAPDLMLKDSSFAVADDEAIEAVEGFWIPQPWLLSAGCPSDPTATSEEVDADDASKGENDKKTESKTAKDSPEVPNTLDRRIGIAQFFSQTDSRTGRRNHRAYEVTKKLADDQQPSTRGYDLVLSGRLKRLPEGRVIACHVAEVEMPPICIISAEFDRVRIEQPETANVIAEWRS